MDSSFVAPIPLGAVMLLVDIPSLQAGDVGADANAFLDVDAVLTSYSGSAMRSSVRAPALSITTSSTTTFSSPGVWMWLR